MNNLPQSVLATANLSGKEYAWPTNAFLAALDESASAGFACIGGQFQFRFPDGTCEMYWLEADARDKEPSEIWSVYVERARQEVKAGFENLIAKTDFAKEAKSWPFIENKMTSGANPLDYLFFCAYFVSESEYPKRAL